MLCQSLWGTLRLFGAWTTCLSACCSCLVTQSCPNSFATPWTVAHQAPLSSGFLRQEYRTQLTFSPPGDLPDPETEPSISCIAGGFFTIESLGKDREAWLAAVRGVAKSQTWLSSSTTTLGKTSLCSKLWSFVHLASLCVRHTNFNYHLPSPPNPHMISPIPPSSTHTLPSSSILPAPLPVFLGQDPEPPRISHRTLS